MRILPALLAVVLFGGAPSSVQAQGSVQFLNTALSKLKFIDAPGAAAVDAPVGTVVGVFWGRTADDLHLEEVTTVITSPGLFNGGTVFNLTGTNPGEAVYLRIGAWLTKGGTTPRLANERYQTAGITHYGESAAVLTTALGPAAGPGTVVWQGPTGTNPNRAKPFEMSCCVPEPSTWALGSLGLALLALRRRGTRRS